MSTHFASAGASGAGWRDAAKLVLEKLQDAKISGKSFNFGFLYVSDHLAQDVNSILTLFRSVLNIEHWIGAVGVGVCATGEEFIDQPAISALIGCFNPDDFCVFPAAGNDITAQEHVLRPWLEKHQPMMVFIHGDPLADEDPAITIQKLEQTCPGFLVGGLSSSRKEQVQIAGEPFRNGVSGAVFSKSVKVATSLSQGCVPIGATHTITSGFEHVIYEIDSRPVVEIFEEELHKMAAQRIEKNPDFAISDDRSYSGPDAVPNELRRFFKGEISVAFPVAGSDKNDYLVRNIIGINEDNALLVSQRVAQNETMMFVYRDDETVQQDLSKTLVDLRKRIEKSHGRFEPKGAIYISCAARAFHNGGPDNSEMKLVREIIGDVPLAGFYAGGEICNARLYGYTGVLTLFL